MKEDIEEIINLRGSASSLREIQRLTTEAQYELAYDESKNNMKISAKLARIEGMAKGGADYLEQFIIPHLEKENK